MAIWGIALAGLILIVLSWLDRLPLPSGRARQSEYFRTAASGVTGSIQKFVTFPRDFITFTTQPDRRVVALLSEAIIMKDSTTQPGTIKKTDLWMAVILFTFFLSIYRFCNGNKDIPAAKGMATESETLFCPGGISPAFFCAAGDPTDIPLTLENR